MIERKSTSATMPVELLRGPTLTLYRFDIQTETFSDGESDGEEVTLYTYTEYAFGEGEYELVRAGLLPSGAVWTDELRRIERGALLDEADKRIQEGEDYSMTQRGTEWTDYVRSVREYKVKVRETIYEEGFPAKATYPVLPTQPTVQDE